MRKIWGVLGAVAVFAIGGILAYGRLASLVPAGKETQALTVGATIFPLADIVRQVGGEAVNVVLIIPPGVSEHSFSLTPQQLQELSEARAVFEIGQDLDSHLTERITSALPGIQAISVDRGIALQAFGAGIVQTGEIDHDEGVDPHYWLAVPNAMQIAQTVADELTKLDPERSPAYAGRLAAYARQLAELETDLQAQAKQVPREEFMATHNAWSYFAKQYGLKLVATYEPVEGKQPSLADLTQLREIVNQYHLTAFFAEPQKATTGVANFMQREFGLKILVLDPVGGLEGKESYADLMRANMAAIVNPG